jgi:hypothetical protein
VTFSILSRFCTRPGVFQSHPKRRHPERSASRIYRITERFMARSRRACPERSRGNPAMLVGRCSSELSGHRLQGNLKSHSLRAKPRACPERSRMGICCSLHRPPMHRENTTLTFVIPTGAQRSEGTWARRRRIAPFADSALKNRILCKFMKRSRALVAARIGGVSLALTPCKSGDRVHIAGIRAAEPKAKSPTKHRILCNFMRKPCETRTGSCFQILPRT